MRRGNKYWWAIFAILALAAFLRISFLSRGDTVSDEVLYAFRAIGMMDFDEAEDQTTPLEWFDPEIPWWTRLSFHDHPPLVFLAEHISMRIFGESPFGFRLPGALLGVASVYLLFLISRKLFGIEAGLFASAFLAVTVNHVYISRIGLQESFVIFFLLLTSYLFLKSFDRDTYFLWMGAALGGALLTKYTTIVLVPLFLSYLCIRAPEMLKNKKLWLGCLIALMLLSPVILYNIQLWRAVGHFDFQLSFIAGQRPEVWSVAPGKEIGSLGYRLQTFIPTLIKTNSWMFLFFTLLSSTFLAWSFFHDARASLFLLLALLWVTLLILVIGASYRFLTLLTPFFAMSGGVFAAWCFKRYRRVALVAFTVCTIWETVYSVNTEIFYYPKGEEILAFAPGARSEQANWGYHELEKFLAREFEGKMPAQAFYMKYSFLEDRHRRAIDEALRDGRTPYSLAVIYDGNVHAMAQLWVLDRWNIYHAWPVVKIEQYRAYMQAQGITDITTSGFEHYYFIRPTDAVLLRGAESRTDYGALLEAELVGRGISPTQIFNRRGEEAFRVYAF